MPELKNCTIFMLDETHRGLKCLAAKHGIRMGDALAGLLSLAAASPALMVARAMAAEDSQEGEQVQPGSEAGHIAQAHLGGNL